MTGKVDIVIRAKDGHALTGRLVQSIQAYTPPELYRLILVDDGSREPYGDLGQHLTVRHAECRGAVSATNSGLALAILDTDSPYILVLDNDAEVPAGDVDWLERFVAELEGAGQDVAAAGATTNVANPPQHILTVPTTYTANWKDQDWKRGGTKDNPRVPSFVSFAVLLRKAAIRQVGFWDERYNPGNYEDTDYAVQLRRAGWGIVVARSVYLHHHGHATFGNDLQDLLTRNMGKFAEKWGIGYLADMGMVPPAAAEQYFRVRGAKGAPQ